MNSTLGSDATDDSGDAPAIRSAHGAPPTDVAAPVENEPSPTSTDEPSSSAPANVSDEPTENFETTESHEAPALASAATVEPALASAPVEETEAVEDGAEEAPTDLPASDSPEPRLSDEPPTSGAREATYDAEELAREYGETLRRFQNLADRRKAVYQGCWVTATGLTWATLILAVISISIPGVDWWHSMVLQMVLPSMGVIVSLITITQSTLGMQGRWLAARGAAEELKHDAMRFRVGLPPYDQANALETLHERISLISELSHRAKSSNFHERFRWGYFWDLLTRLPPREDEHRSLPDEGIFPRLPGANADVTAVLDGRLRHQRRWYLRKARGYAWMFVTFQATIVSISMANAIYVFMFGRRFELVALSTALSLGIMAYRDFFDYGPMFFRYVQAAGNLREIEEAYLAGDAPFDEGDQAERLRRLSHYVEETIAHEFLAWQASRR